MAAAILSTAMESGAVPRVLDARLRQMDAQVLAARRAGQGNASALTPAFVQTDSPGDLRVFLRAAGGRFGTEVAGIVTVLVPKDAVGELGEIPGVRRVEAASRMTARLDRALPLIGGNAVFAGQAPLHGRYDGKGVVIGIIDFALDPTHAAFLGPSGSRVLGLWDMGIVGTPPPGFSQGHYCDRDSVIRRDCPHVATDEHGTHVAGIALGATVDGNSYQGVASGAELLAVALGDIPIAGANSWFSSSVCEAAKFIFEEADRQGKPAVVNVSLGHHAGPHDGSSLADSCLDQLVGPGHLLVASAGNEGQGAFHWRSGDPVQAHASGDARDEPERAAFRVPLFSSAGATGEAFVLEVWANPGATLNLRVGARDTYGNQALSSWIASEETAKSLELELGGHSVGPLALAGDATPSGSVGIRVEIQDSDNDGTEAKLDWFVDIRGAGHYDAFIDTTQEGGFVARGSSAGVTVDSSMTIGYPALARGVIAVGSFVSRDHWTSAGGTTIAALDAYSGQPLHEGAVSGFSSRGPTRDPERTGTKPDLIAPGEAVISALPSNTQRHVLVTSVVKRPPNGYWVASGTSQAAPFVAGVLALMLQRDPTLTPDEARNILHQTAAPQPDPDGLGERNGAAVGALADPNTGDPTPSTAVPSLLSGYGRVDALAAVQATPELFRGDPVGNDREEGCSLIPGMPARTVGGRSVVLGVAVLLAWRRRRLERQYRSRKAAL